MADEIKVTASLEASSGFLDTYELATVKVAMAGLHQHSTVQDIGTTYEAIVIPADLATAGWTFLRNLDPTNYVEVGLEVSAAFQSVIKLKPGEPCVFPASTKLLFARANTAAVKLKISMLER